MGPENRGTVEMVPAARALRLMNERRDNVDFISYREILQARRQATQ